MAYIYKITNDINNKIYVGKTNLDIKTRWRTHLADRTREHNLNRPLYRAMNKYGIEHFHIEEIEECSIEEAPIREQYWIEHYNSYHYGYNATLGGDGKTLIDYDKVLELYDTTQLQLNQIAKIMNCGVDAIRYIVAANRENPNWMERTNKSKCKAVWCVEEKKYFSSMKAAAEWLAENHNISFKTGYSHISKVCQGKRASCGGFTWQYV